MAALEDRPLSEDECEAVILDHNERPRGLGMLNPRGERTEVYNPLCGDRYTLEIRCDAGRIVDAAFDGRGCAVSKASLSMLVQAVRGRSAADALVLQQVLDSLLRSSETPIPPDLGELAALTIVRNAPTRVRCALLGWTGLARLLSSPDS